MGKDDKRNFSKLSDGKLLMTIHDLSKEIEYGPPGKGPELEEAIKEASNRDLSAGMWPGSCRVLEEL